LPIKQALAVSSTEFYQSIHYEGEIMGKYQQKNVRLFAHTVLMVGFQVLIGHYPNLMDLPIFGTLFLIEDWRSMIFRQSLLKQQKQVT
jgi:hypothetical protein